MSTEKPRNPFILNFCEALIRKRGISLPEEGRAQELERMYQLLETMLGRKLVEHLPEDKKSEYLALCRDLSKLDFNKVEEIFGENVSDPHTVMKEALEEFTAIYLKNR